MSNIMDFFNNIKNKKFSKTGFVFLKSPVEKLVNSVRGNLIYGYYSSLFKRNDVNKIDLTKIKKSDEKFQAAQAFYGTSDTDIDLKIKNNKRNSYVGLFFTIVSLVANAVFLSRDVFADIMRVSFLIAPFIFFLQNSYYYNILKNKRIISFKEFISDYENIIPGFNLGKMNVIGMWALFLVLSFVSIAHAQTTSNGSSSQYSTVMNNLLQPPNNPQDVWFNSLEYLFPNLGILGTSSIGTNSLVAASGIAAAFQTFIVVLMALSVGMLSYHMTLGIIETNRTGSVLGKSWNSTWAFIRPTYGFALLAPVIKGFCLANLIVLEFAVISGNMGNMIWSSEVQAIVSTSTNSTAYQPPSQMVFLKNLLNTEVCAITMDGNQINTSTQYYEDNDLEHQVNLSKPQPTETVQLAGVALNGIQLGVSNVDSLFKGSIAPPSKIVQYTWDFGNCGAIKLSGQEEGTVKAATYSSEYQFEQQQIAANATYLNTEVSAINALILSTAGSSKSGTNTSPLGDIVNQLTTNNLQYTQNSDTNGDIQKIMQDYHNYYSTINNAVTTDIQGSMGGSNNLQQYAQGLTQGGWATAGSLFMTISRLEYDRYQAISAGPSITHAANGQYGVSTQLANKVYSSKTGTIPLFNKIWNNDYTTNITSSSIQPTNTSKSIKPINQEEFLGGNINYSTGADSLLNSTLNYPALSWAIGQFSVNINNGSALNAITQEGNDLLAIFMSVFILIAGLFVVGSVAKAAPEGKAASLLGKAIFGNLASKLTGVVMALVIPIMLLLLVVGITEAFVIPMLPYYYFLFFFISTLEIFVEGMVAAPLWAFFHIRMDGQEMINQNQAAGYSILFNLLFRIPLALFGLFFSLLIMDIGVWFVNYTFTDAFYGVISFSGVGPLAMLFGLAMGAYLQYSIAIRSFKLIDEVPDRVGRWFGSNVSHNKSSRDDVMGIINYSSRISDTKRNLIGGAMNNMVQGVGGPKNPPKGGLPKL